MRAPEQLQAAHERPRLRQEKPTSTTTTNPNKALWEKGDFILVQAGNARAQQLGLNNVTFQEGDASELKDLGDEQFDLVVSVFGAMFAPRPFDVAQELVRVIRPGGRIVLGSWISGDPTLVAQILRISSSYSPPPPEGFVSPMTWGSRTTSSSASPPPASRRSRSPSRGTDTFEFPGSPSELLNELRMYYGPTMNAFEAGSADGREAELQADLDTLFNEQNRSATASSIPATFLRVDARRSVRRLPRSRRRTTSSVQSRRSSSWPCGSQQCQSVFRSS